MKKIVKIAKLELSIMFYSPIAWLVLIIFFVQTSLIFTDLLYRYETIQQLERPLRVLTKILFAGDSGILAEAQAYLYLYIPLLTMGLMSRETSSGSIKLLYSSPVTIKQIILGKYLSAMVYNFILTLVLVSFIVVGVTSVEALDIPFILGGILGIYLLMCAYAAIGLFMSSLTIHQVVAAISTLAVLAILNFIGNIGQTYDFIRDITYWISIKGRADQFVNGLLSTKDILYFILVIGLFLLLSILKLSNERTTRTLIKKSAIYALLILLFIGIGYVTSLPSVNSYYDTTRFKDRTLTKNSQAIVKQLDKPIHITTYVNVLHYSSRDGEPKNRIKDLRRFEKYRRFLPNMTMDYIYYYHSLPNDRDTTRTLRQKAIQKAKALHINFDKVLSPEAIKKKVDVVAENSRLVRFIQYGNKTLPLRMFDDIMRYPSETNISSALKRIIEAPAVVGVLTGHGERNVYKEGDDSYKNMIKRLNSRNSLINIGFNVIDIPLKEIERIPMNLDVLVLADPKYAYSKAQEQKIIRYINAGGNLLIAGEPGRQAILNPIVNTLGVTFMEGVLLQKSKNLEMDFITSHFTAAAAGVGFKFYDKAIVVQPKTVAMSYSDSTDFDYTPILMTDKETTWIKQQPFDLKTQKITFDSITDKHIEVPTVVVLQKKLTAANTQKIMLLGDADFMSNRELNRSFPQNVNLLFALRQFKWFSDNRYPVSTRRPKSIDTKILLSRNGINWLKVVLLGLIPTVIGLLGAIILIRRRQN